jgi:hypothetical protein
MNERKRKRKEITAGKSSPFTLRCSRVRKDLPV